MKTRTKIKAGRLAGNENATVASAGVRMRTKIKSGATLNENQTIAAGGQRKKR